MAGPRPMPGPNQPQGYQQNYAPPPGNYPPGQPYQNYPPPKKSGGMMKGCIIALVIVFVLGFVGVAAIGGLAWFGISKGMEMLDKECDASVAVADSFMSKLAAGDVKGAHALCDSTITPEALQDFFTRYEKQLKGNKGLTYSTEEIPGLGLKMRGAVNVVNDEGWVTLNAADLVGQTGVKVRLTFHRSGGGSYKVMGFWLENVPDVPSQPLGSGSVPRSRSGD